MKVQSPLAKSLGGIWLACPSPPCSRCCPDISRWAHVIPIEGLLGRVVGDFLIHYLNLVGAYIVCCSLDSCRRFVSLDGIFTSHRFSCGLRRGSHS